MKENDSCGVLPLSFALSSYSVEKEASVYNFVNPGVISHSEILALYKSLIDPNHTYQLVNKEVLKTLIKAGRSDNCLDTTKLESALPECQIPHISVSIQDVFTRMKKNVRKNILLTGGAGFIGSHVANFLVERYSFYHVVVVDKITYCSNEKNLDPSANKPNFVFIKADISDAEKMKEIFETYQIDTVMHFAAETLVDNSFNNSNAFTNSNVIGTHTLLHCARHFGVELFLHVSTDEVYGEVKDGIPRKETATLTPTNPYSASKAAAEMLVQSYHHSFHVPVIITRSNNVYGPAQYPEKVIPSFLGNIRAGKTCPIYGHGQHLRNFLYVGDAVEAFDLLLHKGIIGQTYNIGVNNEHTVMSIAKQLHEILGKPMNIEHVKDRPYNDTRYVIDSTKLHLLGWKPKTSWKEGLKKTIEWYLKHGEYYWG
ncbi:trifunctional UDP-glucose 4,6-dehydratase/UDP-4-keto-6-deoxy-D-glucose 3,5-epimerase/UDP-4-keto-L-rhamnose-reductase RHM3-like [Lingula anatina]|uniref:dTDP-D-glucose 4,6-dehydratase n=1 Tax=Lingula anatina TaxID=7574 RepID=A0A1S3JBE1_LINAN|nr:trifunctional UDP-glucose 4,6-dehydratase/UDP-4-keto-6-deoxy-D-glucose 3,5-epimerase/UDP-4-keto-L-rhamnose-reductase RHM3-like [Lingula anatina]|eukprot:XP_013407717.1 trifunctional UDP-glucose 4,6-dehydratase/UDP-4-keto-6-deoxy-D-glucose 3,5-epimerase/UDP-4-keto-L-rhamnose-reductase RHM3-like [Lingula anatina]